MRFQTYILAAVAAATGLAQAQVTSAAVSAASSVVSSAVLGGDSSSASRSASSASSASASSASSVSSASASASNSATSTASSAAATSSGSSDDDEEVTSTRVYTTTYYYLKHNPTYAAVSPTLMIESVVVSTSGISDQMTFSTPSDAITVLSLSRSTYTTTWTSDNQYAAQSPTLSGTKTVTTTFGLPDLSTRALNAGAGQVAAVGAGSIGGIAAFFLGAVALL